MTAVTDRGLAGRVLVLFAADADLAAALAQLGAAGIECLVCADADELARAVRAGVGALLLADAAPLSETSGPLLAALAAQPVWSTLPVIVLARADEPQASGSPVTWLDRPVSTRTLVSVVQAALRAREQQYRLRDALVEQARQAAALQERDERIDFTLEAAELGWWELDFETGHLESSAICRQIYGRSLPASFTFTDLFAVIHPADLRRVRATIDSALAERTNYDIEYRIVWPDGAVRWVLVRGRARYCADGRPRRAAGLALDITERERAAILLREKDERLSLVVGNVDDYAFLVMDTEGRIVEWLGGAEQITGWSADEVHGRSTHFIFTPEDLAHARPEREMQEAVATGRASDKRWHMRRDGSRFFADGVTVALRDESGALRGFGKVFQDVSERKRAEEQLLASEQALQEADRRKDEFLATLAHELRNPLAPIRTGLQVLQRAPDEQVAARTRQMMERQVNHMVRLIDDLLDISRVTRGRVGLKAERVTLQAVVDAALESSRPLIDAAGHSLHVHIPSAQIWLDADPTRLAQVLGNLLNNAAKYTPNHGEISVVAWREGGEVVVEVRDNGIGIASDKLTAVFEIFAQIHQAIDRAQGGLGIGLALVRKLLEMHGGSICAASPGPGEGSIFTLRLPVAADPVGAPTPIDGQTRGSGASRRVLVVDDNVDIAETSGMLIEFLGHEVRIAHNGTEALAVAHDFVPDLVLLDIGLPGLNGYEVAGRMRADEALAATLLVAVTGWGTDEDKRKARLAGFDHHLTKPVETRQLEALLSAEPRRGH